MTAANHHFLLLTPREQREAIRRLRRQGMGLETIAAATGMSVEQIRRVLTERQT